MTDTLLVPPTPRPAFARAWAWLLALALVLASTLGHVHGALHGPWTAGGAPAVRIDGPGTTAAAAHGQDGAHGLWALFGGHDDGGSQCRLYDQLAHGSALPSVVAVLLPVVLPAAVFDFMQGEALARWVLLFDARGPPAHC